MIQRWDQISAVPYSADTHFNTNISAKSKPNSKIFEGVNHGPLQSRSVKKTQTKKSRATVPLKRTPCMLVWPVLIGPTTCLGFCWLPAAPTRTRDFPQLRPSSAVKWCCLGPFFASSPEAAPTSTFLDDKQGDDLAIPGNASAGRQSCCRSISCQRTWFYAVWCPLDPLYAGPYRVVSLLLQYFSVMVGII